MKAEEIKAATLAYYQMPYDRNPERIKVASRTRYTSRIKELTYVHCLGRDTAVIQERKTDLHVYSPESYSSNSEGEKN